MEFRDLKKQYEILKEQIDGEIAEVISSGRFIGGGKVAELEGELAAYVGVKHCVTCGNGTDALELSLMAMGIGEGDAVFVPDFTFFSTGEVVSSLGATPVFVDVLENTFNIDAKSFEAAVEGVVKEGKLKPAVVMPVDLFGMPADYEAVRTVAKKYGIRILEDAAQGFGGEIKGTKACALGDIAATSFFPAKPLGCYGDGGAIFTNSDEEAELLRSYCVHGKGKMKYDNVRIGMNSRLDAIQAGVLLPKLKALAEYEVKAVNEVAAKYTALLKDTVKTPIVPDGFTSSWAQYTIKLNDEEERDALKDALKEQGIPSMVYYPKPMHAQEAFTPYIKAGDSFPVTERLCKTVLSLPMHPYMSDEDINKVAAAVRSALENIRNS